MFFGFKAINFLFVATSVVKFWGMVSKGFLLSFLSDSYNNDKIEWILLHDTVHKYIGLAMSLKKLCLAFASHI